MTNVDQVTLRRRGSGLIAADLTQSAGGYTLFAPQTDGGNVYLIDVKGTLVHSWKLPYRPGRDAVLLPNGNLGYNGNHPDSPDIYPAWSLWHGGAFIEVTPDGEVVWQYSDIFHHHDAQWLPNGHLLYATVEPIPGDFAKLIVGGSSKHDLPDGTIYGDVIKEVNREGEVVWLWRVWEHLNPSDFPIHPFFDRYHWPLINGLGLTRAGLVLLSLRTTSGVLGIDKGTGDVVWRIGHDIVAQQHTPVELANGNILIFDNGNSRPGIAIPFSRVIEVNPVTKAIEWEYADELRTAFFSPYMGGAERLVNGNTYITEAATGRLFEVTPEGKIVWEYVIPYFGEYPEAAAHKYVPGHHNSVFRSHRYAKSQIPWL
ncbi:MAG: aryl-sulfate sulfotransferase [Chroococcidiopsidaceae cyanobacterium CP_BM_ER_R8_30]|nr:aryl-sulfate sulfotransferase [Chroococcidiopsidaceae cyanobacterium CP_BM_ER_R8_30]